MGDQDAATERDRSDDEGLISRFWKAPTPVAPSPAPPPSTDGEAEEG